MIFLYIFLYKLKIHFIDTKTFSKRDINLLPFYFSNNVKVHEKERLVLLLPESSHFAFICYFEFKNSIL